MCPLCRRFSYSCTRKLGGQRWIHITKKAIVVISRQWIHTIAYKERYILNRVPIPYLYYIIVFFSLQTLCYFLFLVFFSLYSFPCILFLVYLSMFMLRCQSFDVEQYIPYWLKSVFPVISLKHSCCVISKLIRQNVMPIRARVVFCRLRTQNFLSFSEVSGEPPLACSTPQLDMPYRIFA